MNKKKSFFKTGIHMSIALLIIAVFLSGHHGRSDPQAESGMTVIQNVRIFNGEKVLSEKTVVLEAGRISLVTHSFVPPADAKIIDGKGKTLLPGLINSHVHVWSPANLKQALVFGVTTVVDMFMDVKAMASIKKQQIAGKARNQDYLISAGTLTTAPRGHGTQFGVPIPTLTRPEEALDFVDARIAEGSDFIKIIWDDGSAYGISWPTLDKETVDAVIKAASKRNKLSIIHAATLENCMDAMEAGVSGLAHLYFNNAVNPDFGLLASRKKTFVIPTLTVLEGMHGVSGAISLADNPGLAPYLTPNDITMLKSTFPMKTEKGAYAAAKAAIKQLVAADVPILAGTDAPNPGTTYGASMHRELEILVKAGLTPLEALKAATSVPAKYFGLNKRGRIQKGFVADLLLVEGDPTKNILATRNIKAVWREGVRVDRDKYKASVQKQVEVIEQLKDAPPPKNSESGWISDFEGDKITANFGAGWSVSTDAIMGGKSKAKYQLSPNGAQGSKGFLLITGTVASESATPWAGAFFSPGPTMFTPVNLSFKKSINFWARGDGKTYSVMVFAQSHGFLPESQTFKVGPGWKEYNFPFEDFKTNGFDIMGIFIGSAVEKGEFKLQIDDVRLK